MKVESEPDRVDPRFVIAVASASVAITGLCCGIAWLVLRTSNSGQALDAFHRTRTARPPAEINQIEADLIQSKSQPPDAALARSRLQSFGWSDRERGVVHVPIERAFDLYLSGARAAGAAVEAGAKR
jgi:hypothetical protein